MPSFAEAEQTDAISSPWRVLVAGGSYAGLAAVTNLLDLCEGRSPRFALGDSSDQTPRHKIPVEITVVDQRDGYYHLIGSPLALAASEYASKAWVEFKDVAALKHTAIKVVRGSVSRIEFESMTATITEYGTNVPFQQDYDFLIAASGLRRVWPTVPQSLTRKEYMSETQGHINAVTNAKEGVVVIGGGAVGIEMAAELKEVQPSQMVTLIHSREKLLSSEPLPDDFKDKTLSLLRESGVNVILGQRVTDITSSGSTSTLTLSNGAKLTTGHVISAVSKSVPSTTYLPSEALDPDGYVKISPSLNFSSEIPNYRHHFAVGDIAAWSGIKRCGAAMHMGNYAAENTYQQMLLHSRHQSTSHDATSSPSSTPSSSTPTSETASSNSIASSIPESDFRPTKTLSEHPPMIGLALGKTAISYSPTEGIKWGEDVMQRMFGDDLGWSICWNYMQLGKLTAPANETRESRENVEEAKMANAVVDVEEVVTPSRELRRELAEEMERLKVREMEIRSRELDGVIEVAPQA